MEMQDSHEGTIAANLADIAGAGVLTGPLVQEDHLYAPAGFLRHRVPSIDTERAIVFRNWSRVIGMRRAAHILVLDHNTALLDILGQLLDGEGYNVTLACHALRIEDVQRLRPDLVVADASLARDGGESSLVAHALRNTLTRDTTLLLTTSTVETVRAVSDRGFRALLKPFDLDEMLELIAHATS